MMNNDEPIEVVLASDEGYFIGMHQVIHTLVHSAIDQAYHVHVIDGGLSGKSKELLGETIAESRGSSTVSVYSLDQKTFEGFRTGPGHSYMAYARVLMPSILPKTLNKVIYLDSDLMIQSSLEELWKIELGDVYVAASQDAILKRLKDDYPLEGECPDLPYFNSGVMLVNLKKWRIEHVQERVLEVVRRRPESFKYWDQTAFNAIFLGEVLFVDKSWNMMASQAVWPFADARILHFLCGAKPWKLYPYYLHDRYWYVYRSKVMGGEGVKRFFTGKGWRLIKDGAVTKCSLLFAFQLLLLRVKSYFEQSAKVSKARMIAYRKMRADYLKHSEISAKVIEQHFKRIYR